MRTFHAADEVNPQGRKVCLAIGFFDGVHLGHQQIIRQTLADARRHEAIGLVVTFDRHPSTVVTPHRVPPLIYSLPQRLRTIESLGTAALLLLHFDKAFSLQTGEQFVRALVEKLGQIRSISVGANFVFGHNRTGDVELLKRLGRTLGFTVHGLAAVSLDGKIVSSTRIREAIARGNLDAVSQMLGRPYSIAGQVTRGDGLGRRLGFPTANLDTTSLALPPHGVYAVHAEAAGESHRAVLNIGLRPTLNNPRAELRVEAHLLDFDADLYGQEIEISFVERLRPERRFGSLRELRNQIAQDILDAQLRY